MFGEKYAHVCVNKASLENSYMLSLISDCIKIGLTQ